MANILIIEDDSAIAQAYMIGLSNHHTVHIAPDALSGLQLAAEKPDVILLDMLMPSVSGLDFLRQLDPKKNLPDTKIIAISNVESAKIVESAKELGVCKYLLKVDFTPSQIETVINEVLTNPAT